MEPEKRDPVANHVVIVDMTEDGVQNQELEKLSPEQEAARREKVLDKLKEMGKKFRIEDKEDEVKSPESNTEDEDDVYDVNGTNGEEEEDMLADLAYLYPDKGITEQERTRRATVPVEIIIYNSPAITLEEMEAFVEEEVKYIDASSTLSDFKTVNQVGITVIGIETARRVLWRVNKRAIGGSEAHIRQTDAGWERLRDLKMNGLPMDLGNIAEWQEAIAYELDYFFRVLDVVIFRERGSGSVIARNSKDADNFKTVTLEIMGAEITFTRTQFTKLEAPGDVIVEGFNASEVAAIKDDVLQLVGPYNSFRTVVRSGKSLGCISFVNFNDAKAFVEGDVVITLRREETRKPVVITANWLKEWNSSGGRLNSGTSAGSPAKGNNRMQPPDNSLERRVNSMERSNKKSEEAYAAMEFRLKKEMLEQTQLNWELIGENNAALWQAVATSLSKMNAKSLDAQTCLLELSSLIGELGTVNSRMMLFEAVGINNPSVLERMDSIAKEKATVLDLIEAKKAELKEINSREVAMAALPPIIKPRITMGNLSQGTNSPNPNRRRLEDGRGTQYEHGNRGQQSSGNNRSPGRHNNGHVDHNINNNNNTYGNQGGGSRSSSESTKKAKVFKFKPDPLMRTRLEMDTRGKSNADIRTIMNVAWAQENLKIKKFVTKNDEGRYTPIKDHSTSEWGKILGNLVAIAEVGPSTNRGQQAESVVVDIEEYLTNKEEEELLNTKVN